jgi:Ca2+-binding EF-hand superfamily protein
VPERWDADRDDVVSRGELRAALADDPRVLASDRDEDQELAPSELLGLAFADWDVDHDGVVTSEEWSRGRRAWLGSAVRDPFDRWDRDRSGRLDRGEVERGLREAGLPRAYDTDHDGSVSLDELATTLVAVSDVDRDADLRVVELDALGAGCLAQPPGRASIPVSQDPAVAGIPDRDR